MSQFSNDQQIAAILGSGRPSPMRGINKPLEEGGGPQTPSSTDQSIPTPQTNLPSFQAPQQSIAQSSVPSVSPIAQAAAPQMTQRQKLQQAEKSRLAANLNAFHNMGNASNGQGGFIGANGNFGNSVSGSII
jgi:hypothetical protein